MTEERGRSIVFFPRSYNKRGDESLHSMTGATLGGEVINVKLRIDEKHRDKKNAPSISEFSRDDVRAKNPCIASDDNGPKNREGVMLLSRCTLERHDKSKGMDYYIAKWAVLLAHHSDSPDPVIGLGRMEIKKDSPEMTKLKSMLKRAEEGAKNNDIESINQQIEDPKNWSYPAILYFPETTTSESVNDIESLINTGGALIDEHTYSGLTGGLAIRAFNQSGQILESSYEEIFSRFIVSERRYQTGREVLTFLTRKLKKQLKGTEASWIEAFAIQRINAGPVANKFYGEEDRLSFTRYMFTEGDDDTPRLGHCCLRVSYFEDTDNTLLARFYTMSEPLDHPARLDKNGYFSRIFKGEQAKPAHQHIPSESIRERKDEISDDLTQIHRSLWLLGGESYTMHTSRSADQTEHPLTQSPPEEKERFSEEDKSPKRPSDTGDSDQGDDNNADHSEADESSVSDQSHLDQKLESDAFVLDFDFDSEESGETQKPEGEGEDNDQAEAEDNQVLSVDSKPGFDSEDLSTEKSEAQSSSPDTDKLSSEHESSDQLNDSESADLTKDPETDFVDQGSNDIKKETSDRIDEIEEKHIESEPDRGSDSEESLSKSNITDEGDKESGSTNQTKAKTLKTVSDKDHQDKEKESADTTKETGSELDHKSEKESSDKEESGQQSESDDKTDGTSNDSKKPTGMAAFFQRKN